MYSVYKSTSACFNFFGKLYSVYMVQYDVEMYVLLFHFVLFFHSVLIHEFCIFKNLCVFCQ
jgi:hypothetical protein